MVEKVVNFWVYRIFSENSDNSCEYLSYSPNFTMTGAFCVLG